MQNLATKIILIVAFLGLCVWSLIPPSETIRLGKDLRGGVSLIYRVTVPETAEDRVQLVAQLIEHERLDSGSASVGERISSARATSP